MPATVSNRPITRQEIKRMLRQKAGGSGGGGVSTSGIKDDSVTFEKLQEINTQKLIGRNTPDVGNPEEIGVTGGIEFRGKNVAIQDTGVTPGTYGDAGNVAQVTIDASGRVTAASEVAIVAGIQGLLVTGDIPGPVFVANGEGAPVYII